VAEPYCNASLPVDSRIDDLVARMTLAEKIDCITSSRCAVPRLAVAMTWAEALHGLRYPCITDLAGREAPLCATSFPHAQVCMAECCGNRIPLACLSPPLLSTGSFAAVVLRGFFSRIAHHPRSLRSCSQHHSIVRCGTSWVQPLRPRPAHSTTCTYAGSITLCMQCAHTAR
jgi:hypothetical protein